MISGIVVEGGMTIRIEGEEARPRGRQRITMAVRALLGRPIFVARPLVIEGSIFNGGGVTVVERLV